MLFVEGRYIDTMWKTFDHHLLLVSYVCRGCSSPSFYSSFPFMSS
jgi:hypothetical protein